MATAASLYFGDRAADSRRGAPCPRAERNAIEAALIRRLSAVCQQTARNPRTADGLHRTKCLVRDGMDGFHRSLKVATRVRIPLGVPHERPGQRPSAIV